jgi:GcrA cell cycle regulator
VQDSDTVKRPIRGSANGMLGAARKTMTTLMPNDCRWPIGDPQATEFHFCGQPQQAGHSYCEFHMRCSRGRDVPSRR